MTFNVASRGRRQRCHHVKASVNQTLQRQHFLPLTLFLSFPLPILAKSRGGPSGERDFARIGRGKERRGAARAPARCGRICQSKKYKIHKLLGSQHGVDCNRGLQQFLQAKKKIWASRIHTLQEGRMAAGFPHRALRAVRRCFM